MNLCSQFPLVSKVAFIVLTSGLFPYLLSFKCRETPDRYILNHKTTSPQQEEKRKSIKIEVSLKRSIMKIHILRVIIVCALLEAPFVYGSNVNREVCALISNYISLTLPLSTDLTCACAHHLLIHLLSHIIILPAEGSQFHWQGRPSIVPKRWYQGICKY